MRKDINKIIFSGYIVLFAALVVCRFNLIEIDNVAHLPQTRYTLSSIGVFTTLIVLPLSVIHKRFNASTRLYLQLGCAFVNVAIHILTLESSSLLCAATALCISIAQANNTGKKTGKEE